MLRLSHALLATGTLLAAGAAHADPIYLQPGQCIIVGSQQVCAMNSDQSAAVLKPSILWTCRYGTQGGEIPDLKSYALYQVRINPSGTKNETLVKSFGPNDKEACEKEAQQRQTQEK